LIAIVNPVFDEFKKTRGDPPDQGRRTLRSERRLDAGLKLAREAMNHNLSIAAAVGLSALLIASAAAQTPSAGQANGAATATFTVPAGSLQKVQNAWRGRMLIGAPVFNNVGQRIATINDLLITDDGMVDRVVLSVTQPPACRSALHPVPFRAEPECRNARWTESAAPDPDCDRRNQAVWRNAA
jgi:PRC-barrel domain